MALITRVPWNVQPPIPVEIDWANPICRALFAAYPLNNLRNARRAKYTDLTASAPLTYKAGVSGLAADLTGGSTYLTLGNASPVFSGSQTTFAYWIYPTSITNSYSAIRSWIESGGSTQSDVLYIKSNGKLARYQSNGNYDGTGVFTLAVNTWYYIVETWQYGGNCTVWVNGVLDATFTAGATAYSTFTKNLELGREEGNAGRNYSGLIEGKSVWTRVLSPNEIKALSSNPWQIFQPLQRRIYGIPAAVAGKVDYTLTCAAGAYTYTGQAATLTVARKLALAAGAYTYTGQAATLTVARTLALAAGAYTYTGNAATLTYVNGAAPVAYTLSCAAGSYVYTGQAATLTYTNNATGYSGGYLRGYDRKRTKQEIDAARRRFGIDIPPEVAQVIEEAAADQVADLQLDEKKQKADLKLRLKMRQIEFETQYLKALAIERERLIDEEIKSRIAIQAKNNANLSKLMLLSLLHA